MTVSTALNKTIFPGNGSQTVFNFSFPGVAASDIQVYYTDASGNITLLSASTYTLTLNAAVAPNPTGIGGSVTYPLVGSPIATGTTLTILRTLPLTQPTSLNAQGALWPTVIEEQLDQLAMQIQQVNELLTRQLTVAVSDSTPGTLPTAAARALQVLGFDSAGNPIATSTAPAGVISSAMAPFVGAASIAAAKALLGYGTMANENIGAAGKGIADDGSGNALVKHTISAVSTNQSSTSANHMTDYVSSGSLTHTLPKLTTVFNGYELWFFCLSGTAALTPNASDNFPNLGGGVALNLTAGQCARVVGDGVSAWSIIIGRIPGVGNTQTRQVFTSGSAATYNTPVGCRRLVVRMVGGGGGGAMNGTANGTIGVATSFGTVTANPGGPGLQAGNGGSGGTGGAGTANLRINGGLGGVANASQPNTPGGGTTLGPGSFQTATANTGAGGGSTTANSGGGGGGEYVEIIINNPASSYTYTVGTGGAAGGAGANAGAAGQIIVDEYY